jgi:hypothetical protein
VRFVQIFVVELDQFDALILFQSREFFELLAEQINPELHRSVLVKIVEGLEVFAIPTLAIFHVDALQLVPNCAAQGRGV